MNDKYIIDLTSRGDDISLKCKTMHNRLRVKMLLNKRYGFKTTDVFSPINQTVKINIEI